MVFKISIYILYYNDGTYYGIYNIYTYCIFIYITIMELIMLNVKCLVLSVVAGDIYSSLVLVSELLDAMVRLQGEPI